MKGQPFIHGLLVFTIALVIFSLNAGARPSAILFDDWAVDDKTDGVTKDFGTSTSPSGKYSITSLKSDQDQDIFILIGKNTADGRCTVLGYGTRGSDVRWFKTRMGEIAIINYNVDAGQNELFAIMPLKIGEKESWHLLYRSPDLDLGAGYVIEQCYWTLIKLDPDLGSLKIRAEWTYSDITNAQRKTMKREDVYVVPLFYGYK